MKISVRIANPDVGMANSVTINVAQNWKVQRIVDQINAELSIEPDDCRVRLFGVGKELMPDMHTHQYNLQTGMTLHCTLRPAKASTDGNDSATSSPVRF